MLGNVSKTAYIVSLIAILFVSLSNNLIPDAEAKDMIIDEKCVSDGWSALITDKDGNPLSGVRVGTLHKISSTSIEESFFTDENGSVLVPFSSITGFVKTSKGGYRDLKLAISCDTAYTPNFLTYHNSAYGIKLEYPANWRVMDKSTETFLHVKFISPKQYSLSTSQDKLELLVMDLEIPQTIEEHAKNYTEHLTNTRNKFKLLDSSEVILDGMPAHKLEYSYAERVPVIWMEVFTIIDQWIYLMAFSADSTEFSNYSPTFQKILNSFEIEQDSSIPAETIKKLQIPDWIRNNAKWWSEGAIGDNDFVSGLQYLIKEKIMQIPETSKAVTPGGTEEIPAWIKNNADWWSQGLISDDDFVKGIQYLVEQGIIKI